MGVPGLWSQLDPAATDVPLPSYLYTSFYTYSATSPHRSLRLGIDASLWLFHSQQSTGGSHPHLRTLFFRLARLLSLPLLPVFVFDGPKRPEWKRGKKVLKRQSGLERDFKLLIRAFGFVVWKAPAEAEAELVWLERKETIQAIVTDDVDVFVFGAQTVIRNWGKNLSGTIARTKRAAAQQQQQQRQPPSSSSSFLSSDDEGDRSNPFPATSSETAIPPSDSMLPLTGTLKDSLITLYKAWDIRHMPELSLSHSGLILVALLSGGDYDGIGLLRCGVKIAIALAQAGFGDRLVDAFKRSYPSALVASAADGAVKKGCARFEAFLRTWCQEVEEELRTDSRGFLRGRKQPKLAASLSGFTATQSLRRVLSYYVWPVTTGSLSSSSASGLNEGKVEIHWPSTPSLEDLVRIAQHCFEWNADTLLARFRSTIWSGIVLRKLREEILHTDGKAQGCGPWAELVESPASKAIRKARCIGRDVVHTETLAKAGEMPKANSRYKDSDKDKGKDKGKDKERSIHDSPQATRITNFFAKVNLVSSSSSSSSSASGLSKGSFSLCKTSNSRANPLCSSSLSCSSEEHENDTADTADAETRPIRILSISRRRHHVAYSPHEEVRALIDVSPLVSEVRCYIDHDVDATPSSLGDPDEGGQVEEVTEPLTNAARRDADVDVNEPMLLWIVESVLRKSQSGHRALRRFEEKTSQQPRRTKVVRGKNDTKPIGKKKGKTQSTIRELINATKPTLERTRKDEMFSLPPMRRGSFDDMSTSKSKSHSNREREEEEKGDESVEFVRFKTILPADRMHAVEVTSTSSSPHPDCTFDLNNFQGDSIDRVLEKSPRKKTKFVDDLAMAKRSTGRIKTNSNTDVDADVRREEMASYKVMTLISSDEDDDNEDEKEAKTRTTRTTKGWPSSAFSRTTKYRGRISNAITISDDSE